MKFLLEYSLFTILLAASAFGIAINLEAVELAARAFEREPHYAQIVEPTDGSTVSIVNGKGELAFRLLDGSQDGSSYTLNVYLGNQLLAKQLPFNGYVVETTFSLTAVDFPTNAYTLRADEISIDTGAVVDSVSVSVNVQVG